MFWCNLLYIIVYFHLEFFCPFSCSVQVLAIAVVPSIKCALQILEITLNVAAINKFIIFDRFRFWAYYTSCCLDVLYIQKGLWHRCFPVNFEFLKYFKYFQRILKSTCERLFFILKQSTISLKHSKTKLKKQTELKHFFTGNVI